jgi:hypothetical protein
MSTACQADVEIPVATADVEDVQVIRESQRLDPVGTTFVVLPQNILRVACHQEPTPQFLLSGRLSHHLILVC